MKSNLKNIIRVQEDFIVKNLKLKAKELEKDYKRSPLIKDAEVSMTKDGGTIRLTLNFETDDKQDVVRLLEYGGVIKDENGEIKEVKPGFFIRNAIQGF